MCFFCVVCALVFNPASTLNYIVSEYISGRCARSIPHTKIPRKIRSFSFLILVCVFFFFTFRLQRRFFFYQHGFVRRAKLLINTLTHILNTHVVCVFCYLYMHIFFLFFRIFYLKNLIFFFFVRIFPNSVSWHACLCREALFTKILNVMCRFSLRNFL